MQRLTILQHCAEVHELELNPSEVKCVQGEMTAGGALSVERVAPGVLSILRTETP